GYIELIERMGELNQRQEYFSERAMLAIKRMEGMISELLDYARLGADAPLKRDVCDLSDIIDSVRELLQDIAAHRRLTMQINVAETLRPVMGDAGLLQHVVSNLMSNAIKYNRKGGEIFVHAYNVDDSIRLDVRDTGIGIPEESIPFIFNQFYRVGNETEKVDGTGLGLAIVKEIVVRHGGEVSVKSVVGEGSTFSVILPRMETDNESGEQYGAGEVPDDVDDDLQESQDFVEPDTDLQ
ncbi:MAG: sensor histidine kinase, partial [Aggregatilineales bacterium]